MPDDEGRGLPASARLVRTTPEFGADTVPAGLLRTHRVADGVWGRLVVRHGEVSFVYEDTDETLALVAGDTVVIEPGRPHRVARPVNGAFVVEFYTS